MTINNKIYPILNTPSHEQERVLKALDNYNVIVDSVAGSGKTTTNLHVAKKFFKSNILLLTYNSKLKIETREKVKTYGIENLEVHSYHSFCVKYYDNGCYRDNEIYKLLDCNKIPIEDFKYDIIVIDEAQDMNPLYYRLVNKIFIDNGEKYKNEYNTTSNNFYKTKICVLGDKFQSIYDFNNADNRFIRFADKCYKFNDLKWKITPLTESFRITEPMSGFINNCMIGQDRIKSIKPGRKPEYIICNTFGNYHNGGLIQFNKIKNAIYNGKYKPDEIFILAPSINSKSSPVRALENKIKLSMPDIPIYVPSSNEDKVDKSIIENKLVISTFHQTKGLERKLVFIFNFDDSYFKYYKRDADNQVCPNELYVAITRATEHVVLFHHYKNNFLPFLNEDLIEDYADVTQIEDLDIPVNKSVNEDIKHMNYSGNPGNTTAILETDVDNNNTNNKSIHISVTTICNHMPSKVINDCMKCITVNIIREKRHTGINIPSKTERDTSKKNHFYKNKTIESISEINGLTIPIYYEYILKGNLDILNILPENENQTLHSDKLTLALHKIENNKKKQQDNMENKDNNKTKIIDLSYRDINKIREKLNNKTLTINDCLYIATRYNTYKDGYLFKLKQIQDFDWISNECLNKCMNNLNSLNISNKAVFEKYISTEFIANNIKYSINGIMDCIDGNDENQVNIYEFKCTSDLEETHILQLAIYAFINETERLNYILNNEKTQSKIYGYTNNEIADKETKKNLNKKYNYYLYNIFNDELLEIKFEYSNLVKMIDMLIRTKFAKKKTLTDFQFISNLNKY